MTTLLQSYEQDLKDHINDARGLMADLEAVRFQLETAFSNIEAVLSKLEGKQNTLFA